MLVTGTSEGCVPSSLTKRQIAGVFVSARLVEEAYALVKTPEELQFR